MKVGYTLVTLTYAKFRVDLYMRLQLILSGVCFCEIVFSTCTNSSLNVCDNLYFRNSLTCYSFVLQETPLQKLEEFNISYNWLGDSCGSSLAVILKRCPILNALKLESCGLSGQLAAQGKEFALALKGKYLNF